MEYITAAAEFAKNGSAGIYALFLVVIGGFVYVLWKIVSENNKIQQKNMEALERQSRDCIEQMRKMSEKISDQQREFTISLIAMQDSTNVVIKEHTVAIKGFSNTIDGFKETIDRFQDAWQHILINNK